MKPGKPLARKTPLRAKSPLVSRTGFKAKPCSLKRTGISPVSQKRAQANSRRTRVVNAMRLAAAGRCARCGRKDQPVYGHERLARAHGGSIINPDCLLCNECNGWCEDNPQIAAWTGWKVSSKWAHDPALEIGQAWDLAGNLVVFHAEAGTDELRRLAAEETAVVYSRQSTERGTYG